jgi:hypothetical protein
MSTKPEVDRTITQLALFMQARDAKQFGATVDGQLTPSWDDVGPAAQEEYLRDAGAILVAVVTLGYSVPGALEAAEAEPTRRDTAIAAVHDYADAVIREADGINFEEDNFDAGLVHVADHVRQLIVGSSRLDDYDTHCPTCDAPEPTHTPTCAVLVPGSTTPVSLEATKTETTTEWGVRWISMPAPAVTDRGAPEADVRRLVQANPLISEAVTREVTEWRPVEAEGVSDD